MSSLKTAQRLYRGFREAEPTKVRRIAAPRYPRALMIMGRLDFVGYTTTHRGVETAYKHTFAHDSRPLLCTDGKKLYLLQGRYRVTARGIVDIDRRGREES